jgi:hypothetical protein
MERAQNDYGGDLPNRLTIKMAAVGQLYDLRREPDADASNDVVGGPDIADSQQCLIKNMYSLT